MSAANLRNELGPYKATKLWNDIVRVFRTGMPIGRHWKQLKAYDDCFVACEAVDWLYEFLQQHHDAGAELTRPQIVKLLQKFHRNNYMEDVRGYKYNSEPFDENNRLFRFVALSPIKTPQWPRVSAGSCPDLTEGKRQKSMSDLRTQNIFKQLEPDVPSHPAAHQNVRVRQEDQENKDQYIGQARPVDKCMNKGRDRHATHDGDNIWRFMLLERLKQILQLSDISEVVTGSCDRLSNEYVKHNMTVLHKNGYVTGINKGDLPPSWVISAMRYLSKWPDKGSESFPEYPGFEKDVFIMIKDYFESVKEPLTTYLLYPVLTSIYNTADRCNPSPIEKKMSRVLHVSETTPSRRNHVSAGVKPTTKLSEGVVHPPDYNTVYPPSTALPHKLRPRVTSPHHLPPALGPGLPAPGPGDPTGGITTSPPSRHSAEELIVVYDDSPVKSKNAPPYRPPPPPPSHKLYHYEPRAPPLQSKYQHSYRQALHSWAADQNINNNNNDDKKDERRSGQQEASHTGEGYTSQRRPAAVQGFVRQRILAHQAAGGAAGGGGMIRAASLSHLLVGPRIETAFVGEDAYTVYYGAARNNTRTHTSLPTSSGLLMRAQSAYNIDQDRPDTARQTAGHLTNNFLTTGRSLSTRHIDSSPSHQSYAPSLTGSHQSSSQSAAYYTCQSSSGAAGNTRAAHTQSRSSTGSSVSSNSAGSDSNTKHAKTRDPNTQGGWDEYTRPPQRHTARVPAIVRDLDSRAGESNSYRDAGSIRLKFHSTPSVNSGDNSLPHGLCDAERNLRLVQSLQLVLLLLPPANRRVLHMLLKLLHKTSCNDKLVLDSHMSNKRLVITSLWRTIIRSEQESELDDDTSQKLTEFMIENYEQIMTVPHELKQDVLKQIVSNKSAKDMKPVRPMSAVLKSKTNLLSNEAANPPPVRAFPSKAIERLGITPSKVYCAQITTEQMKHQANTVFERSMRELLKNIVDDKKMSTKEKSKKLKQFERTYPEIFAERFPNSDSVRKVLEDHERRQPKLKPALLSKPINLLRKLR